MTAGVGKGHAHGHRHGDRRAALPKRERHVRDGAAQAFGALHGGRVIGIGQRHEKLLATQTGHQIARTQLGAQAAAEPAQHLVAGGMAVPVVDALEVVEVQHHHHDALARPGHHLLQPVKARSAGCATR